MIKQDNAPPHINNEDTDFRGVATADGFDIELHFQPPNSPYTNINDLGWFGSIHSIKSRNISLYFEELIVGVDKSFNELKAETLSKVFLTCQSCLIEVLKRRGMNNYEIPHLKKDALIKTGLLPRSLKVDAKLVSDCISYMIQVGRPLNELEGLTERFVHGTNANIKYHVTSFVYLLQCLWLGNNCEFCNMFKP